MLALSQADALAEYGALNIRCLIRTAGRWKATPVAVKIIEHHGAGACSSEGKAVSAGRETLLGQAVAHPNVVTTYHISTMSMSERSALASSWLECGGPASSQQAMQQEPDDSRRDSDSDGSSNSSDMDEGPPGLLETWVIMECASLHLTALTAQQNPSCVVPANCLRRLRQCLLRCSAASFCISNALKAATSHLHAVSSAARAISAARAMGFMMRTCRLPCMVLTRALLDVCCLLWLQFVRKGH